jgi:hypothetical protein
VPHPLNVDGLAMSALRSLLDGSPHGFPPGTNPVSMVCGCNGGELLVGSWDSVAYDKFPALNL